MNIKREIQIGRRHFIIIIFLILFFSSHNCLAENNDSLDVNGLLNLKLPKESAKVADKINSYYYTYINNNVESIQCNFTTSENLIERLRKEGKFELIKKLENIDETIEVKPLSDPYVRLKQVFKNTRLFQAQDYDEAFKEMMFEDRLISYFWYDFKPFITQLIDPKKDKVQSVNLENDNLIIIVLDREGVKEKFIFNKKFELQFFEASNGASYRVIPTFEIYDSKYLIKTIQREEVELYYRFDIEYQMLEGVKVPKGLLFTSKSNKPPQDLPRKIKVDFINILVRVNK